MDKKLGKAVRSAASGATGYWVEINLSAAVFCLIGGKVQEKTEMVACFSLYMSLCYPGVLLCRHALFCDTILLSEKALLGWRMRIEILFISCGACFKGGVFQLRGRLHRRHVRDSVAPGGLGLGRALDCHYIRAPGGPAGPNDGGKQGRLVPAPVPVAPHRRLWLRTHAPVSQ